MDACGHGSGHRGGEQVVGRQEGGEDVEQAAGALSHLHLSLGDSRVLVTVSHIWLCKKSWCFVFWTKSAKHLGSVEAVPAELGGFSHVLGSFADLGHAGALA